MTNLFNKQYLHFMIHKIQILQIIKMSGKSGEIIENNDFDELNEEQHDELMAFGQGH